MKVLAISVAALVGVATFVALGHKPAPKPAPVTLSSYDEITVWQDPATRCEYLVVKQHGEVQAITPRLLSDTAGACLK